MHRGGTVSSGPARLKAVAKNAECNQNRAADTRVEHWRNEEIAPMMPSLMKI
jgi:hypothetical protein